MRVEVGGTFRGQCRLETNAQCTLAGKRRYGVSQLANMCAFRVPKRRLTTCAGPVLLQLQERSGQASWHMHSAWRDWLLVQPKTLEASQGYSLFLLYGQVGQHSI